MANEYWLGERFAGVDGTVMEIRCNPVKCYQMSVGELRKLTDSASNHDDPQAYFHDLRSRMIDEGYGAVELVEMNGLSDMSILFDLDAITCIEKHDVSAAPTPGP